MMGWSKGVLYAGLAMLGGGGLLIFLAWNGAARIGGFEGGIDYTQGQIPYLISGGLGGLALVAAGVALIVVQSLRRDLIDLGGKLDAIVEAIHQSSNGRAELADGPLVIAGRTSYHELDCGIVEGRQDLQVVSVPEAAERGLAPCRICHPPAHEPIEEPALTRSS